jgi:16S rRNA (cytidine1402-2'-O)-methyltransferase
VLTALVLSGLPVDRFCFEGFLPRKAGERARRLDSLSGEERTLVFFEAPHRTAAALEAMADAFGPERAAAACRELTKTHEEVRRGPLAELVAWAGEGVRGEVTIVVSGAGPTSVATDADSLCDAVADLEAAGESRKEAIKAVAARAGLPKRTVYDAVHAIVHDEGGES